MDPIRKELPLITDEAAAHAGKPKQGFPVGDKAVVSEKHRPPRKAEVIGAAGTAYAVSESQRQLLYKMLIRKGPETQRQPEYPFYGLGPALYPFSVLIYGLISGAEKGHIRIPLEGLKKGRPVILMVYIVLVSHSDQLSRELICGTVYRKVPVFPKGAFALPYKKPQAVLLRKALYVSVWSRSTYDNIARRPLGGERYYALLKIGRFFISRYGKYMSGFLHTSK